MEDEILMMERFSKSPPFNIKSSDFGVITAVDGHAFIGFQVFIQSLIFSHELNVIVYDIGLSVYQKQWCKDRRIEVRNHPDLIIDKSEYMWQTWNKPLYIEASPFRYTLWIDCDTIIVDNISHLARIMRDELVIIKDYFKVAEGLRNNFLLYNRYSVPKLMGNEFLPNGGVLGIDKERDKNFLDTWIQITEQASKYPEIRPLFKWWDQGAILWSLEKIGQDKIPIRDRRWNYACSNRIYHNLGHMLDEVNELDAKIVHFAGRPKPWHNWRSSQDSIVDKIKIFICGHEDRDLSRLTKHPHLVPINLNKLDIEHQFNQLAENRIFLSDLPTQGNQEYIGFGTYRWNDKFRDCMPLENLYKIYQACSKRTVWVPLIARNDEWIRVTERFHPGMMGLVQEAADFMGVSIMSGTTFWTNCFICHRDVYEDFVREWRRVFFYFHKKYDLNIPFTSNPPYHAQVKQAAFFYERITMLYFLNRTDLSIYQINPYIQAKSKKVLI